MGMKKRAHSTEMQSDIRYRLVIISHYFISVTRELNTLLGIF